MTEQHSGRRVQPAGGPITTRTREQSAAMRRLTDAEFEEAYERERQEIIARGGKLYDPDWRNRNATGVKPTDGRG